MTEGSSQQNKERTLCILRRNQTPYGGAENYLSRLSSELNRTGYKHQILYSRLPKFLPSWLRAIIYSISACLAKSHRFYFSLERVVCPDVYRAGDGVHREFLKTKKRRANPLNTVYLYLEKRCFNNARRIIVNSNMIKQQIIQHYGIDPDKISLVYSGIEMPTHRTKGTLLRDEFDINKDSKIILYVGSGFERKGVRELLELLGSITDRKYTAIIIGEDRRLRDYQQQAEILGIKNNVIFTGARSDVDRFYAESDLLIQPSRYEPFSNVVLEAMAHGNAVITTRQNGASEVLQADLIMENSGDRSILPKIMSLLDNDAYLEQIKLENLAKVKAFTIERNARKTLKIIEQELLSR